MCSRLDAPGHLDAVDRSIVGRTLYVRLIDSLTPLYYYVVVFSIANDFKTGVTFDTLVFRALYRLRVRRVRSAGI
jgi:hypothetical protein